MKRHVGYRTAIRIHGMGDTGQETGDRGVRVTTCSFGDRGHGMSNMIKTFCEVRH